MENKKVLLIAVYSDEMDDSFEEPGICSIAAFLRRHDIDVAIMAEKEKSVDLQKIIDMKPFLIGFSIYNVSKDAVFRVIHSLKKKVHFPCYICLGGSMATSYSKELMNEEPLIDFIIKGEGELPFLQLINRIIDKDTFSNIKGLVYRNSDKVFVNEGQQVINDGNDLPIMARDILKAKKNNIVLISTSRGCSGNCTFCISKSFWKKWRGRDAKSIVDEMESVKQTFNVDKFNFIDSSFEDPDIYCSRLRSIADEILNRKIKVYYYADFRADIGNKASKELIRSLHKSGLCSVLLGIEAGNEQDLKLYAKNTHLQAIEKSIELFNSNEIHIIPGFINFNPYSTMDTLKENINFLYKHGYASFPLQVLTKYRLFKGTALYSKIERDGLLSNGQYFDEFKYRFVDKKVELLDNFLFNIMQADKNQEFSYFNKLSGHYKILLKYYIKFFEDQGKYEAREVVTLYEAKLNEVLNKINERIYEWFYQLLDLCIKDCWCNEDAFLITKRMFTNDFIHNINEEIKSINIDLTLLLFKIGERFEAII
ncbi:radical SAM protein [Tissierella sp.]|uniref:B12-binding domain-containing radical SAM protein n=1 Tax=Tissierella sp. TaxID=41274 RepID=UPI00303085D3